MEIEYFDSIRKTAKELNHPFYCYHIDGFRKHLNYLKENSNKHIKLWFATKANPLSVILDEIIDAGIGLDIASSGELEQVLNRGADTSKILATGPAKSKEYLKNLLIKGVKIIVIESENQLLWLNEIAEDLAIRPKVLLRIQLSWDQFVGDEKSVLGGTEITPFGLGFDDWKEIDLKKFSALNFIGIHVFQWANILETQKLKKIWNYTATAAVDLCKHHNIELNVLDLGGGIGIPYNEEDKEVKWEEINDILTELKFEYKLAEIWLELGRFAVGEYGNYLVKVIDKKVVRGMPMLILEGGINQLARPTLTKQSFPCLNLDKEIKHDLSELNEMRLTSFQVHGPLCTSLDKLGIFKLPVDTEVGDWLLFSKAGAYGFTESMPFFLCHPLPGEVIIQNKRVKVLRVGKSATSWLA